MAWLVALPIWAHDVGYVPVARWAGRHLPLALPFGGPGELQVQRGCSCNATALLAALVWGRLSFTSARPEAVFLQRAMNVPPADRTGRRTVCFGW